MATDQQLMELWRNIHLANAAIRSALSARLAAAGDCSLPEHDLMSWLQVEGEHRPRMLDLAERLGLTQGGVTRLVDRLVERGWVEREQPPGNRRVMHARLTATGRRALATTRKAYLAALREAVSHRLDDRQVAALTKLTTSFRDTHRYPGTARTAGRTVRTGAHAAPSRARAVVGQPRA